MSSLNASADKFLQLLVLLHLAYRRDVARKELKELLESAIEGARDFAHKHKFKGKVFKAAADYAVSGKRLAREGYPCGHYQKLLLEIKKELSARRKWIDDPEINPQQVQVARAALRMFSARNGQSLENGENTLEPKLHFLENPDIRLLYTPGLQGKEQPSRDLKFLVKKLIGKEGHHIPIPEQAGVKAKDPERYKKYLALHRQASGVYKAALRSLVRSSGKNYLPIPKVRKQLEAQGIVVHNLPRDLDPLNIGEDGRLYTRKGKLIQGFPSPGFVRLEMNPDTESADYIFKYWMPGEGKKPGYGYLDETKRGNKDQAENLVLKGMDAAPRVRERFLKDLFSSSKGKQQLGTMAELIYSHSLRIGGVGNKTGDIPTYGLSTLRVRDIRFLKSGKIKITYPGKKAVIQEHLIKPGTPENERIIEVLRRLTTGKKPDAQVFDFNAAEVNAYLRRQGSPITAHKYRHVNATRMMLGLLDKHSLKKDVSQAEAEKLFKDTALKIALTLGHFTTKGKPTPTTAIRSYILPEVGVKWFKDQQLRVPEFLRLGAQDV